MTEPGLIYAEGKQVCELCGKSAETRPYGPDGEEICFECGQKNVAVTEQKMGEYLL